MALQDLLSSIRRCTQISLLSRATMMSLPYSFYNCDDHYDQTPRQMSQSVLQAHSVPDPLFPLQDFAFGFTTCTSTPALPNLRTVSLSPDSALCVHKNTKALTHNIVHPPDPIRPSTHPEPRLAWEACYPKGSCSPKTEIPGGLGFYLNGPKDFSSALENEAQEAVFSYRMMFSKDWEWVKGGKLPGACTLLEHKGNHTTSILIRHYRRWHRGSGVSLFWWASN